MKIDLNIDEFNKTLIVEKSPTTDNEYWILRNYVLNKFYRDNKFWTKYKGTKIYDSVEIEKNIEKDMAAYVDEEVRQKVKFVVLINGSKASIFVFQISSNLNNKDKLIYDFDIIL